MKELGIQHSHTKPLWQQANTEVEAFNKNVERAIRAAGTEGRLWQQELSRFLLNYCLHCILQQTFHKLGKRTVIDRHNEAKQNQVLSKEEGRDYADNH